MKKHGKTRLGCAVLFAIYCLAMLWLLFLYRRAPTGIRRYNLIPLQTIRRYLVGFTLGWTSARLRIALVNLAGNVAVFVPLGWFLPRLFSAQRRLGWFLLTVLLAVSAVELCQMLTTFGTLDIDDLLLNALGAVIGWTVWKTARGNREKRGR